MTKLIFDEQKKKKKNLITILSAKCMLEEFWDY